MEFKEFADRFVRGDIILAYDIKYGENLRYLWSNGNICFTSNVSGNLRVSSFDLHGLYESVMYNDKHWTILDKFSKRCSE